MKSEDPISEEPITDYARLDLSGTYSYFDYLRWHFKERVELIRGKVFKMSPAPNVNHQSILLNLGADFGFFFKQHSCRVFPAPFDVRLPIAKPGKDYTVVQPDICVICDDSKLDKQGCKDAPDLVVEILSPGNSKHEMQTKFELYEEAGVKEYWIVEPEKKLVLVYSLKDGKYIGLRPFLEGDTIDCVLFPQLKIAVDDIFFRLL
jgi:Uma2 family endonuclease